MALDIPAGAVTSVGDTGLEAFLDLGIADICPTGFGKAGDADNHCAHFVCHALRFTGGNGFKCSGMNASEGNKRPKEFKQMGAMIRVNELYRHVSKKTKLDTSALATTLIDSGLIFVTKSHNMSNGIEDMGTNPKKHVGIIKNSKVFHYGNTKDKVRADSLTDFVKIFTNTYGNDIVFVTTSLPAEIATGA